MLASHQRRGTYRKFEIAFDDRKKKNGILRDVRKGT